MAGLTPDVLLIIMCYMMSMVASFVFFLLFLFKPALRSPFTSIFLNLVIAFVISFAGNLLQHLGTPNSIKCLAANMCVTLGSVGTFFWDGLLIYSVIAQTYLSDTLLVFLQWQPRVKFYSTAWAGVISVTAIPWVIDTVRSWSTLATDTAAQGVCPTSSQLSTSIASLAVYVVCVVWTTICTVKIIHMMASRRKSGLAGGTAGGGSHGRKASSAGDGTKSVTNTGVVSSTAGGLRTMPTVTMDSVKADRATIETKTQSRTRAGETGLALTLVVMAGFLHLPVYVISYIYLFSQLGNPSIYLTTPAIALVGLEPFLTVLMVLINKRESLCTCCKKRSSTSIH